MCPFIFRIDVCFRFVMSVACLFKHLTRYTVAHILCLVIGIEHVHLVTFRKMHNIRSYLIRFLWKLTLVGSFNLKVFVTLFLFAQAVILNMQTGIENVYYMTYIFQWQLVSNHVLHPIWYFKILHGTEYINWHTHMRENAHIYAYFSVLSKMIWIFWRLYPASYHRSKTYSKEQQVLCKHIILVFLWKNLLAKTAKATETTANQIKLFPYKLFGVPPPPNTNTTTIIMPEINS